MIKLLWNYVRFWKKKYTLMRVKHLFSLEIIYKLSLLRGIIRDNMWKNSTLFSVTGHENWLDKTNMKHCYDCLIVERWWIVIFESFRQPWTWKHTNWVINNTRYNNELISSEINSQLKVACPTTFPIYIYISLTVATHPIVSVDLTFFQPFFF